jgi:hypothetical protein
MSNALADGVLASCIDEFGKLKRMAERAIEQLADEDLFFQLNPDQNSIYVIMKHMAGNMLSRWTDFLTSDGEKPWRHRDQEFIEEVVPRAQVMEKWANGWECVFAALRGMTGEDLARTIVIRGEKMSAFSAISRQISHYGYHVGQIVLLAKHIKLSKSQDWKYLTIPRGKSQEFNQGMGHK